jgi:hypothetical protein
MQERVLLLDGAAGVSSLHMHALGFKLCNVLVPNPFTHVVASLKQKGVGAFLCDVADYLQVTNIAERSVNIAERSLNIPECALNVP